MNRQNPVASACKGIAILLGIISALGSLVYGYFSSSLAVFAAVFTGSFITCLLIYSIGEIINQLTIANQRRFDYEEEDDDEISE